MSGYTRSPRLVKGAIVSFDFPNPIPQVISFQYNPDTITRTLDPQSRSSSSRTGDRTEVLKLKGVPKETINLDVEFDATDQLEYPDQNQTAVNTGIYPQLAALEMILYPKLTGIIVNAALSAVGIQEIASSEAPFTLFIWGPKRVIPVQLTKFSITEEAHDINLNPIRAKVSLGLNVLSYQDFNKNHPGYAIFMAHHAIKEAMAAIGSVNGLGSIVSGNIKLF